jgi:hypothetical protein
VPFALTEIVASSWILFVLGGSVLLLGLYLGTIAAPAKAKEDKAKLAAAKAEHHAAALKMQAAGGENQGVAAMAVAQSKTAAEQIGSIVGSLPEYQRFPGLLVLLGAAMMGVATIQFGGTSLF